MFSKNALAMWAGISSFFATLLAIGAIDILNPSDELRFLSGILVGLITGGAVYSRTRLDEVRQDRIKAGAIVIAKNAEGKKVYTLELEGDPSEIDEKTEVIFTVKKLK
jgi:hypothetical protein